MNIMGRLVTLRAIEPEDLPLLQKWANDPEIQSKLAGWHFPTNMNDQRKWFESLSCSSPNQRFAIEAPDLGLIGTANLVDIDWKNRNAFHGTMLGDPGIRGKGYGVDTIMAIMRYAFDELGLNRLDTTMLETNETSLHVYCRKCGWKEEGRRRGWFYRNGRYLDKVMVGVTRDDYEALMRKHNYWA